MSVMQINEIGAPVNQNLRATITDEFDTPSAPVAAPWECRRELAEQHNGTVARDDATIQVFAVEIEGRPVIFLNTDDALAAADAYNETRAAGEEMTFARKARAAVFFPDNSDQPARTEVLKSFIPVELVDAFKRRSKSLGIDVSRLVSAAILNAILKERDESFGANPIKMLAQWESGRRKMPAWLKERLSAAELQPIATSNGEGVRA